MSPSSTGLLAAAAFLAALTAAVVWWVFVFRRQLPMERSLREKEAELASARDLAARLLDAQALASLWGVGVEDAKARMEQKYLDGTEALIKDELGRAGRG